MYIRNAFVVIQEIRASKNRKNYMHIEKRLKKNAALYASSYY